MRNILRIINLWVSFVIPLVIFTIPIMDMHVGNGIILILEVCFIITMYNTVRYAVRGICHINDNQTSPPVPPKSKETLNKSILYPIYKSYERR